MTNGGTVPVPPLVMVVQTVYLTAKVHCNDAANKNNFFLNGAANILQHQQKWNQQVDD
jgi:hypothetical protein